MPHDGRRREPLARQPTFEFIRYSGVVDSRRFVASRNGILSHKPFTSDKVGDVCIIEITVDSGMKFVLGTVYVRAGTSQGDTHLFFFQSLVIYAAALPNIQSDIVTPILLTRDFNVDIIQNKALLEFMK
jgi:hypothetical protein